MTTHAADIRTFILTLDANLKCYTYETLTPIIAEKKSDTKFAYIAPEEIYGSDVVLSRIIYLNKITLRGSTNTILDTLRGTLIDNLRKLTTYVAIAGYTPPTNLASIKLLSSGVKTINQKNKYVKQDVTLITQWDE